MSEEPKKSRRRRRRPRPSSKNKNRSASKSSGAPAGESKSASSSSGNRRGRSRRRPSDKAKKRARQDSSLTVQQHREKDISPINNDIFIYTYTLRPRSLLDSYEAGPNVAEKMTFEQPDQPPLEE